MMSHERGTTTAARTVLSRSGRYLKRLFTLGIILPIGTVAVTWPAWIAVVVFADSGVASLMVFAAIGLVVFLAIRGTESLGGGSEEGDAEVFERGAENANGTMYAMSTAYYSLLLIWSTLLGVVLGVLVGPTVGLVALMVYPAADIITGNRFNISPVSLFVIGPVLLGELVGIWHDWLSSGDESRTVVNSLPRLLDKLFGRSRRLG